MYIVINDKPQEVVQKYT